VAGQLVTAQASAGGVVTAVWPALAFLAVVAMIEFRPRVVSAVRRERAPRTATPTVTSATLGHDHMLPGTNTHGALAGTVAATTAQAARKVGTAVAATLAEGPGTVTDVARRAGVGRSSADYALRQMARSGTAWRDAAGTFHASAQPPALSAAR
jgi:hypothetical protein